MPTCPQKLSETALILAREPFLTMSMTESQIGPEGPLKRLIEEKGMLIS